MQHLGLEHLPAGGEKICLLDPEESHNVWHSEYDRFREAGKFFGKKKN